MLWSRLCRRLHSARPNSRNLHIIMQSISERDRQLVVREFLHPLRLLGLLLGLGLAIAVWPGGQQGWLSSVAWFFFLFFLTGVGLIAFDALRSARQKKFHSAALRRHWEACELRLGKLDDALKQVRKQQVAELTELPMTVHRIAEQLYTSLRQADIVQHEVEKSEGWIAGRLQQSPPHVRPSDDKVVNELYQIADRNVAEYRQQYTAVVSGVQRTEAQAAVFATTLDTLRLKILGYRLTGTQPEISRTEFLHALTEARAQLDAIDRALDELDLNPLTALGIQRTEEPPVEPPQELRGDS